MILLRVDGYNVIDADVAGGYLRGDKGTKVGVTVKGDDGGSKDFIIVRETFKPVTVVDGKGKGGKMVVVKRLVSFVGSGEGRGVY